MENENKLPPEFKAAWCKALRSGEYKQGSGQLYNPNTNLYCCVGVFGSCNGFTLTKSGLDFVGEEGSNLYYGPLQRLIGIQKVRDLVSMNDVYRNSFLEIADYIEENL